MGNMKNQYVANQYGSVGIESEIEGASPHQIIQMLLDGALNRISRAKSHMERGEVAKKGEQMGKAISLVELLRGSLDKSSNANLSKNLDDLYEYIVFRLVDANAKNNSEHLDEVSRLLGEIGEAWRAIA